MNHSKSDVTLNDITNFILNNKIIKISSASLKDGGSGAFNILLKKSKE